MNEYLLASSTLLFVQYSKNAGQEEDYPYGWVTIALLSLMVLLNTVIIVVSSAKSIFLIIKRSYIRFWGMMHDHIDGLLLEQSKKEKVKIE